MSEVLRVHFLVPDEGGPVASGGFRSDIHSSPPGRFRIACGARALDDHNRGTGEPWAVRCQACVATDDYKRLWRPKPGAGVPDRSEVTDTGCCP